MKKRKFSIAFIALSLACQSIMFAQEKRDELKPIDPIRLGIKGSFNISSMYNTKNSALKNANLGFSAGLFAKVPIVSHFAVQPELYYVGKGATLTYSSLLVNGSVDYNLNYLELPIFLVYNVSPNFNIHAGPYGGILLYANTKNKAETPVYDFESNINRENYKRIDAGFAAGFGLDVGAMGIGIRYYQGLTRVGKEKAYTGYNYIFPDAVNGVFSAYLNFSVN